MLCAIIYSYCTTIYYYASIIEYYNNIIAKWKLPKKQCHHDCTVNTKGQYQYYCHHGSDTSCELMQNMKYNNSYYTLIEELQCYLALSIIAVDNVCSHCSKYKHAELNWSIFSAFPMGVAISLLNSLIIMSGG